jgi:hypothetical protein
MEAFFFWVVSAPGYQNVYGYGCCCEATGAFFFPNGWSEIEFFSALNEHTH